jgi:lysozyme family protein
MSFDSAITFVLHNEDALLSGIVTCDSGGRTRFGIAEKFHPELGEEFYGAPREAALEIAREIYRRDYWQPIRGDEICDEAVAGKLLDMAVNLGLRQAVTLCQRALNAMIDFSIAEDGKMGPRTLMAINACDGPVLLPHLCEGCAGFYRHLAAGRPEMQPYLAGWLARAQRRPQETTSSAQRG